MEAHRSEKGECACNARKWLILALQGFGQGFLPLSATKGKSEDIQGIPEKAGM